ncbi:hypothetical protein A3J43_03250 [Candidatus Uhrbacteria bacterium RIFCSPHIGHO2_12_FULL_54_23]|uniref:Uncharacterized protein n=1 Tax=Candidatus Uhrbacteria bacterium RIFCSPHIGHO2_12_FULL_54_23 TaxID=1802397 RepID=A0A1F7UIZ8_9BACT|nr:MAG: hypothetical protein A3J43_03250 [Candidatus Uhrbacteria bacterium RIFCSPHIGHO2_12_FULL_54_23]
MIWRNFSQDAATRIERKLSFFSTTPDPLLFAETLVDLPPATHRFRIGDWRVNFMWNESWYGHLASCAAGIMAAEYVAGSDGCPDRI